MTTLVELYVNEQFDDLAAGLAFRPERTVFLTTGFMPGREARDALTHFIKGKRPDAEVLFIDVGNRSVSSLFHKISEIFQKYPDCALELTGGSPAVLIAAQSYCRRKKAKAFFLDSRKTCFRSVYGMQEEIERNPIPKLSVEELIAMGGGRKLGTGHTAAPLNENRECVMGIFEVYRTNIDKWNAFSEYLQFACKSYYDTQSRYFCAPMALLNKHTLYFANKQILSGLEETGAVTDLSMDGETVSFHFKNGYVREILTTVGMCLELYVYAAAEESGCFDSVDMSVVLDWDGVTKGGFNDTVNEIDVVMTRGLGSRFVSCKTARPAVGDLYEISYLAKRFGGKNASAVLATGVDLSQDAWAVYMRARDMGVAVIERSDIAEGRERVAELLMEPRWLEERRKQ